MESDYKFNVDPEELAGYATGEIMPMRISANIATYPPREESLKQMISSIYDQVDIIRIYHNQYDSIKDLPDLPDPKHKIQRMIGDDLTDNGKFAGLDNLQRDEYYFTMDDDLIFDPDYVSKTIEAIKKYGVIITYHGRTLKGTGRDYYSQHKHYHCLSTFHGNIQIDVLGSGVSAWDTRYFKPEALSLSPHKKMSDLILSLAAAEEGKRIGLIEHDAGFIKHIKNKETIFETESKGGTPVQNQLADEIYKIKHEN